jgi:hypothetical protein
MIPAWLSNDEFVVKARQARKFLPFLHMINNDMLPGFAAGGQVNAAVGQVLGYVNAPANVSGIYGDPYGTGENQNRAGAYGTGMGSLDALTHVNASATWLAQQMSKFIQAVPGMVAGAAGSLLQNPLSAKGSVSAEVAYAASQLGRYAWDFSQMSPLYSLWMKESGWNPNAVNPTSGAAGIAQSLGHGAVALGDWKGQIDWGMNYIKGRYGSPAAAWAHEVANNWYDLGGIVPPGRSFINNATGSNEHMGILTSSQWNILGQLANPSDGFLSRMGNTTYHVTVEGINIYSDGQDVEALGAELGTYLTGMGARL